MKWIAKNNYLPGIRISLLILCALLPFFFAYSQSTIAYLRTDVSAERKHTSLRAEESRIPFTLIRGLIVLQAQIDHQAGQFILDTGAPLLVINDQPEAPTRSATSFKQEIQVGETTINHFNWAGAEEKKLDALVLDISHLESAFEQPLRGMIGYNVLKRYEVFFDYEGQFILRCDARNNILHENAEPLYSIPFQLYGHLPVITLQVGKRKLRLGLDTGAYANLIDRAVLETLDKQLITALPDEEVQGLDQHVNRVQAVLVSQADIHDLPMSDLKFLATDLSQLHTEDGTALDGLVGYAFLSRMKFSINYPKGRIFVWE